jgi:hypothetical protein
VRYTKHDLQGDPEFQKHFFLQILERTVAATVKTVIAFEYQKSLVWQYSQPGVSELIPTAN